MNKLLLPVLIFIIIFHDVSSQELIQYRKNDFFAVPIKSTFLNSSLRVGGDINYQFRNFFPHKDVAFLHLDNNLYLFRGDSTFPGFHFDYEFTYLSNSDSIIPRFTNRMALAFYAILNGGIKLGINCYNFKGHNMLEWTFEFIVRLGKLSSGGFIYARNVTNKTHYYQIGYRYNITSLFSKNYNRNTVQIGWAISRSNFPSLEGMRIDHWSKLKFELSYSHDFKGLPPISVAGSLSRDFNGGIWYWEIGAMVNINLISELWLKDG